MRLLLREFQVTRRFEFAFTIPSRDEKTIKTLAGGEQQRMYIKLVRSQDPRYVNVWKFHGERTPCRVVSIRAMEAYYRLNRKAAANTRCLHAIVCLH